MGQGGMHVWEGWFGLDEMLEFVGLMHHHKCIFEIKIYFTGFQEA